MEAQIQLQESLRIAEYAHKHTNNFTGKFGSFDVEALWANIILPAVDSSPNGLSLDETNFIPDWNNEWGQLLLLSTYFICLTKVSQAISN